MNLEKYYQDWRLQPIGESWQTHSSILQKVVMVDGRLVLLKYTEDEAECRGAAQVLAWQGNLAMVNVYQRSSFVYLMDYAMNSESLLSCFDNANHHPFLASELLGQTAQTLHQQDLKDFNGLCHLNESTWRFAP
jgi:streptomycin 6-kinase